MARAGSGLAAPQPKRRPAGLLPPGQPLPVPLASLSGEAASNRLWAVYRGQLVLHRGLGPAGRAATVLVQDRPEAEALQLHGCFGVEVEAEWQDPARIVMEDWRPGEEEDGEEQEEGPESWGEVKAREGAGAALHLELAEAFFLAYGLGCLTVREGEHQLGLLDMWRRFCRLEDDFPLRYRVYHHCRAEGWVVRSGYQYGADWGLYKLGPAFHHATYMVRVEAVDRTGGEGPAGRLSWRDLLGCTRVAASVRKDLLVARVAVWADRRDWAGPHCLANMPVTLLRLRRWLPGEARWLAKPGVPTLARPEGGL